MSKKSQKLPTLLKEKTPEKVHPKTLLIAALTAITLAFISARLTGVVNSLVLVAMASVLTAIISEFYRITLEGTRKAINVAVKRSVEQQIEQMTGEIPAVTDEVVEEQETQQIAHDKKKPASVKSFIHGIFISRWAVPIVFTLVAIMTVMGSYVAGQVAQPEYNVVQEVTRTQDISNSKVDNLEEKAKEEAERQAGAARSDAEVNLTTTREELIALIEDLEEQITSEQESNATTTAQLTALLDRLEDQEADLTALKLEVENLRNQDNTTPAPTP